MALLARLSIRIVRSSAGAKTDADLRPWSGSGSQHTRGKGSWELPLRDLLTPLCSRWRRERGCAVAGRGARLITLRWGVRGVQRLATWQPRVERLRRALGGRSSDLARSSRGLYHAFTTASRSACHNRGSRGARLDVEVLRRPRWRWRPAHSDTASRFDRAGSRASTHLGETHRTRVGSDSRRGGRRRAPAALTSRVAAEASASRRLGAGLATAADG